MINQTLIDNVTINGLIEALDKLYEAREIARVSPLDDVMSKECAARKAGISLSGLNRMIKEGIVPLYQYPNGGRVFVKASEIVAALQVKSPRQAA